MGVGSGSGRSLLAASERGINDTTLASRPDGGSWRVLDFPGTGAQVIAGVGPADGRTRWVLGGQTYDARGCNPDVDGDDCGVTTPTIWSSANGVDWTATALAVHPGVASGAETGAVVTAVNALAITERGYVAVGTAAFSLEVAGDTAAHETWVSDDGVTWLLLPGAVRSVLDYGPGLVAAGPTGVIGISQTAAESESAVWALR